MVTKSKWSDLMHFIWLTSFKIIQKYKSLKSKRNKWKKKKPFFLFLFVFSCFLVLMLVCLFFFSDILVSKASVGVWQQHHFRYMQPSSECDPVIHTKVTLHSNLTNCFQFLCERREVHPAFSLISQLCQVKLSFQSPAWSISHNLWKKKILMLRDIFTLLSHSICFLADTLNIRNPSVG